VLCSSPDAIRLLRDFYGLLPHPPAEPFQFFLWEILSRDALPARRDLAWQALRRIPALTPDSVFRAPTKALLEAIGQAGPHRDDRVELIRATIGEFKRHRDEFDADRLRAESLLQAARTFQRLEHLSRDVRDRALLFAAGHAVLPTDDGVGRVMARLEGTAHETDGADLSTLRRQQWGPELARQRRKARRLLAGTLPREVEAYREAILYLRHHAQQTCVAVGPHCGVCPLAPSCESVQRRDPPA
jgi:endonuclease III